jgi:hypothetical protein
VGGGGLLYTGRTKWKIGQKLVFPRDADASLATETSTFRSKEEVNQHDIPAEILIVRNVHKKPDCHVALKAFLLSQNSAAEDTSLLKFEVTWCGLQAS